jgi:thymidylate kinase
MSKNNLIFLSGPNGSGKTTLSRRLCEEDSRIYAPELYSRCIKFTDVDSEYRHFLKIGQRAIESFEYSEIAQAHPEKIILGNRCIYDPVAYTEAYFNKGWISKKEYESSLSFIPDFFKGDLNAPYAIILNPNPDVCMRHLEKRWTEKPKKWKEDDFSYLEATCNAFKDFSGLENILYLDKEQDLSRNGLSGIISWIYEKYKKD